MSDVSHLLSALEAGDAAAAGQLLPLVYDELRRLAARKLAREQPGQTLDATALVHEAYLRLVKEPDAQARATWAGRGHFFAAAAEAMRRILVERARRKKRLKHGGGRRREELREDVVAPTPDDDLLALDEALAALALEYPLHARLVELRYFGGLSGDEAARHLGISPSTADRHWVFARAWLKRRLRAGDPSEKS